MIEALSKGTEVLAINSAAAIPDDGALSNSYAIPVNASYLNISLRPVGTFVTLVVALQLSNNDVTAEYVDAYTSSVAAGGLTIIAPAGANFCRVKVTSSTGASRTGLVVGILAR
jgi:hypothetical protein